MICVFTHTLYIKLGNASLFGSSSRFYRELQKHNNAIKEESALRRREEEEKRKHIAAKFQATLTDISTLMADTQETSAKLRQDNAQLAGKLRTLVNHYDIWEKVSELKEGRNPKSCLQNKRFISGSFLPYVQCIHISKCCKSCAL